MIFLLLESMQFHSFVNFQLYFHFKARGLLDLSDFPFSSYTHIPHWKTCFLHFTRLFISGVYHSTTSTVTSWKYETIKMISKWTTPSSFSLSVLTHTSQALMWVSTCVFKPFGWTRNYLCVGLWHNDC